MYYVVMFKSFYCPSNLLVSLSAVAAGTGGYDPIHQPGEPGCVPPPHRRPAGHRHVLHRLVLRVSSHSFNDTALCASSEIESIQKGQYQTIARSKAILLSVCCCSVLPPVLRLETSQTHLI